ncbi:hypothetical protein CEUSTIGMA_g8616.t1 [Chlamydomonas eustigma]|uniref:Radical SAM core domain-containing protein n=1 Tax=Chlamydomonas eustigma TaxID=1157962 RepID=A0A250XDL1_9CHLO|nr:hypothetical protein CEUSTIGMA_g8616.t1 [Chlamydomonas eustigma]|eukprot:GAX81183.1 hypothetical protein CEUSTIGMA_g8616.t1 [Chlamydomonas eustigma]
MPSTSGRQFQQQAPRTHAQHEYQLKLKSMTYGELEEWCRSVGESAKRAMQLWRWMYADGQWMSNIEDTVGTTTGFSQGFVDKFNSKITVSGGLELKEVVTAKDGTRKMAFKLTEGPAKGGVIETVLIPVVREAGQRCRITICLSTQVGCAMNCQFCYTGRMGLLGNLSTAQVVEQIVHAKRYLAEQGDRTPLTNVVFMGMGEPLHNMEVVLNAIEIMKCPLGLHMSPGKLTVSTVGLVPEIREFVSRSSKVQLAVSLHATTDEVRDWIVPVNRRHNLESLVSCLGELFPIDGEDRSRIVLIEYIMLRGVNDTEEDAHRLLNLLSKVRAKINLILFNPHAGTKFLPSETEVVSRFRSILIQGGRVCTVRDSRGDDEMAACGQLGDIGLAFKPAPMLPTPEKFTAVVAA